MSRLQVTDSQRDGVTPLPGVARAQMSEHLTEGARAMLAAISANATFACPPEAADSNTLVLGALSCVRDMIGACRERIRSREATLADLSLDRKSTRLNSSH